MGLDFAIDQLYGTGWAATDGSDCTPHSDGRLFPSVTRVKSEFKAAGFSLSIRHVQLFDCYQAEWADAAGGPGGAVVGRTEAEAAVYALSQLRKCLASATV